MFVRRALDGFASEVRPQLRLRPPAIELSGRLDRAAEQLADGIGRDAAALPIVEGLHFVTSLYPILLSAKLRGRLGAFYTPPTLVTVAAPEEEAA